jgi:integrase/recombinase XerD
MGENEIVISTPAASPIAARSAELSPEARLMQLWLNRFNSRHTVRAYRAHFEMFRFFCPHPLDQVRYQDVSDFAQSLVEAKFGAASKHAILSAVKSFFSFAARIGALPFDVASPLRLGAVGKDTLNERILSQDEVFRLISAADSMNRNAARNWIILALLYFCGARREELAALSWKDLQPRGETGQVTFYGKGGKTRSLLMPAEIWAGLMGWSRTIPIGSGQVGPVFPGPTGKHLSASQILRIVKAAAKIAGIVKPVSPHWLRHCYCSHAAQRGCPIHLIQRDAGHSNEATTARYLHARPNDSAASYLPKIPRAAAARTP